LWDVTVAVPIGETRVEFTGAVVITGTVPSPEDVDDEKALRILRGGGEGPLKE
jgi:hypothetical protein